MVPHATRTAEDGSDVNEDDQRESEQRPGVLGMFLGATLLALGYQILVGWVATNPNADVARDASTVQPPS